MSFLFKRRLNDRTLEKSSGCAFKLFNGNNSVREKITVINASVTLQISSTLSLVR